MKRLPLKRLAVLVCLTGATLAVPSLARAQADANTPSQTGGVEITPYLSLGSAASPGVGTAIRWPVGANFSVEVETGYHRTDRNALAANVSLLYDLPRIGIATPYLATGIGLDQYTIAVQSGNGPLARQAKTALTVNAGGGVRVPVDEHWGFRTDARWINGVGRQAPEHWRVYNGVTVAGLGR